LQIYNHNCDTNPNPNHILNPIPKPIHIPNPNQSMIILTVRTHGQQPQKTDIYRARAHG